MALLSGRSTTSTITGGYIHIIIPNGAAPSGYDSFRISVADLQLDLQTQINTNTSDISTNTSNITALQNASTKRLDTGETSDYTFTQNADSEIEKIYINRDSGTPTIRIGTTLNGEELVSERVITDQYKKDVNFSSGFTTASRTIYVTISGGSVDIAFYSVESIFN